MNNIVDIAKKLGISVKRADNFKERYYEKSWKISTGIKSLDDLLDGGLYPFHTYEFYGAAGTGKTQLALQLSITGQLVYDEESYRPLKKVVYIDTERSFNTDKLLIIGSRFTQEPYQLLKNIYYSYAPVPSKLISVVSNINKLSHDIQLVIIDNIATPLQRLPDRTPKSISEFIRTLMFEITKIMDICALSIVLTNRVYSTTENILREIYQPYGGITLSSFMHREILLMKESNDIIKAIDINSDKIPAYFKITDRGLIDI